MSALQVGDVIATAEEAEELDLLPAWSGIVDAGGHSWVKFPGYDAWVCPEGDLMDAVLIFEECDQPLTVASLPSRPERVVKAEALREAADAWQTGGWAEDSPPGQTRPALILGMAQRAVGYLRTRANAVEAGETR